MKQNWGNASYVSMYHLGNSSMDFTNSTYYNFFASVFSIFWAQSKENYWQNLLKTFIPPILIVIGSMGNITAFIVLSRRNVRQTSVCYFMSVLAILNTIVLFSGCGMDWVSHISQQPYVANLADWICRLWQFCFSVILNYPTWIVVAMTIDRFLVVWYPRKAQQFCTIFMAKVVTILILVVLIVISIHAMWTYTLTENGCYIDNLQHQILAVGWPLVTATLFSYLPMLIILILDISLIIGMLNPTCRSAIDPNQGKFTGVALLVSLAFLLLSLPTLIVNFIEYCNPNWQSSYETLAKLYLARVVCQIIACLNYSISFILYFTTVPKIRQEFIAMLKTLKRTHELVAQSDIQTVEMNGGDVITVKRHEDTTITNV